MKDSVSLPDRDAIKHCGVEGRFKAIDKADVVVVSAGGGVGECKLRQTCVAGSGVGALQSIAAVSGLTRAFPVGVKGALTATPEAAANPGRCH
jgi:hypothetical protein